MATSNEGLLPLNQTAMLVRENIAYHEYEGVALDHDELADIREELDTPTMICPQNPKAVEFVQILISEILSYHEEDEWLHVVWDANSRINNRKFDIIRFIYRDFNCNRPFFGKFNGIRA